MKAGLRDPLQACSLIWSCIRLTLSLLSDSVQLRPLNQLSAVPLVGTQRHLSHAMPCCSLPACPCTRQQCTWLQVEHGKEQQVEVQRDSVESPIAGRFRRSHTAGGQDVW